MLLRIVATFGLLATSSLAHADARGEVDALVRKQVAAIDAREDARLEATFAPGVVLVVSELGTKPPPHKPWEIHQRVFRNLMVGVAAKVDKLDVTVVDTVAWFHGTVAITISDAFDDRTEKHEMRISGVATGTGGWKIAAAVYAMAVDDKTLIADARKTAAKPATGAPSITGDAELGKVVAGWFAKPQLAKTASTGAVVASGTAPGEYRTGAAAAKLAAAWDSLQLGVEKIDAKMFGSLGFVTVTATMPVKGTAIAAPLVLGAIVVKSGATWRWVSLDWAVPSWDSPQWPHDAETGGSPRD